MGLYELIHTCRYWTWLHSVTSALILTHEPPGFALRHSRFHAQPILHFLIWPLMFMENDSDQHPWWAPLGIKCLLWPQGTWVLKPYRAQGVPRVSRHSVYYLGIPHCSCQREDLIALLRKIWMTFLAMFQESIKPDYLNNFSFQTSPGVSGGPGHTAVVIYCLHSRIILATFTIRIEF